MTILFNSQIYAIFSSLILNRFEYRITLKLNLKVIAIYLNLNLYNFSSLILNRFEYIFLNLQKNLKFSFEKIFFYVIIVIIASNTVILIF